MKKRVLLFYSQVSNHIDLYKITSIIITASASFIASEECFSPLNSLYILKRPVASKLLKYGVIFSVGVAFKRILLFKLYSSHTLKNDSLTNCSI